MQIILDKKFFVKMNTEKNDIMATIFKINLW